MPLPLPCSKVIWQAGRVGTFSSTAQFPLEGSAAALAAAASSALLDPAAAAAAALPTNASYDSAADGAFDELSALMDEEEASAAAAPSPAAEAPAPADSAAPGAPCNATLLGVLASHKSLSTLVALIRTAGGCCRASRRVREGEAGGSPPLLSIATPHSSPTLATLLRPGVEGAFASDVPTTVFAPSNAAWERALTRLPLLRFDPDALRAVLLQHVLVGAPTFGVLQVRPGRGAGNRCLQAGAGWLPAAVLAV